MIKVKRRRSLDPSPDLTPLIDVVFNLLIFFMLTVVSAPQGMAVNLPEASTSTRQEESPTVISITGREKIYLNERTTDLDQLKAELSKLKPESQIMIQGDKEIDYGFFVEVMDVVRQTGSHRIVLAAEVKERKSQN